MNMFYLLEVLTFGFFREVVMREQRERSSQNGPFFVLVRRWALQDIWVFRVDPTVFFMADLRYVLTLRGWFFIDTISRILIIDDINPIFVIFSFNAPIGCDISSGAIIRRRALRALFPIQNCSEVNGTLCEERHRRNVKLIILEYQRIWMLRRKK